MQALPPALAALAAWPHFVCWVAVPNEKIPGKFHKFPVDWRNGAVCDAHDRGAWTTAAQALAVAERWSRGFGHGCGFVFSADDPFFFLDIDRAWDGQAWSPVALDLCAKLSGAAVEVSHSGTGLHIIGRTAPLPPHRNKNIPLGLELYTQLRFVALTGVNAVGDAAADVGAAIWPIAAELFAPAEYGHAGDDWTESPVDGWSGPLDDDELLRRAYAAAGRTAGAVFGGGDPTFVDLFEARREALASKWPSTTGDEYDRSSADQALANMLAFWTGKDCARMERLMRRSALAREKWDNHKTFLTGTIKGACSFTRQVYSEPAARQAPAGGTDGLPKVRIPAEPGVRGGYLSPDMQLSHFAGCYFDNFTGRIFSLPRNTEYNRIAFDVNYGGHIFVLDHTGQTTGKSAWEAFTGSLVNSPAIVDGLAFRPEIPNGAMVEDGSKVYLNSYVPHVPKLVEGDPTPFLDHVARILPNPHDRNIIMHYLASAVQNPGRKFQWWPVIQGAEGNGKSILGVILTFALGEHYTHLVNSSKLAKEGMNFNGWLQRKLLLIIEEIVLGHKRDLLEEIKTLVTAERIPIERKGVEQITGDNRANGLMFTNHEDGVPITVDTRRYAIFYCAQQPNTDWQQRDGMDETYFINLIDWIKGRGAWAAHGKDYGAAVTSHYLMNMPLDPALDPAQRSIRAPETSSMARARYVSLGRVEQEILEAIAEERIGFSGGWISATYLEHLITRIKANVPHVKRPQMLAALGYYPHPALTGGRTPVVVAPDGKKALLYVRLGSDIARVVDPGEVMRHYSKHNDLATLQNPK